MRRLVRVLLLTAAFLCVFAASAAFPRERDREAALDRKVRAFLASRAGSWQEWNVPMSDGKLLHDLILENNYKRVLEIGTSTGHSGIWMAWALSRTGGRLVTIEIDEGRHGKAVENFREAGLSEYIDARLGDAHDLVPKLEGPFDLVFSDADKDWYRRYFEAVAPKLAPGGCIASHNVSGSHPEHFGLGDYVAWLKAQKEFETAFDENGAGMAVSCRKP